MCGIAGFWSPVGSVDVRAICGEMAASLKHRGPDGSGVFAESAIGIGLAHARLSIIDLSPTGAQPMTSKSGRYTAVFNGEIYNFETLRTEMAGEQWKGHSDTEVALALFDKFGVEASIAKLGGMFAFAIWDHRERQLTLIRDRLGKKPLYYGVFGKHFVFGSELKALARHPAFESSINVDAVALLMRHNYIPAPYSIFKNVKKLLPASRLQFQPASGSIIVEKYWSAADKFHDSVSLKEDVLGNFERLLSDAVHTRMIADVPLGAFLSGGIDSSLIVAVMQNLSATPVHTFSIGFDDPTYNESSFARAVAEHLHTRHTEFTVTSQEAVDVVPKLTSIFDEPFSDSSQIPTYLVSALARKEVTVALSGDGGDELFGGYPRYPMTLGLWRKLKRLPKWSRHIGSALVSNGCGLGKLLSVGNTDYFRKFNKLAAALDATTLHELYQIVISHSLEPAKLVLGSKTLPTRFAALDDDRLTPLQQLQLIDIESYLPDDILVKVDRASMACSLETRAPLLDYRVMEFAGSLPDNYKIRDGEQKWILKQMLYRYVPKAIFDRPKMGFGVPLGKWLRSSLREWASDLLSDETLKRDGILDPTLVRSMWKAHAAGSNEYQYLLWDIVSFQAWKQALPKLLNAQGGRSA